MGSLYPRLTRNIHEVSGFDTNLLFPHQVLKNLIAFDLGLFIVRLLGHTPPLFRDVGKSTVGVTLPDGGAFIELHPGGGDRLSYTG